MSLNALLKENGISKQTLADMLGVSRQTVQRMGDEITPEVLEVMSTYEPIVEPKGDVKKPEDYTSDEIREICKRRGGLEADVDREKETDYEIATKLGLKVWQLHEMIDRFTGKVRPQLSRRAGMSDDFIRENDKGAA